MKSWYCDSQGREVSKDDPSVAVRRFICACGNHKWDVLIDQDRGAETDTMMESYAVWAHQKEKEAMPS